MRNNRHFFGKAFDMVGLFFKEGQRNEQWKIAVFNASGLNFCVHKLLNAFPHAIAPWPDNHASPDTGFLGQIGLRNNLLIPASEILRAGDA